MRWGWVVLACSVVFVAFMAFTARGLNDFSGRPLGTDFSSFYAAGHLALLGSNPYDQVALHQMQQTIFGAGTRYYGFAYPPIFLPVAEALALLPYLLALALWQASTFALYLWSMALLKRRFGAALPMTEYLVLAAAFTAVVVNLGHGQNGFLSAALFALALTLLESRPWLAGIAFGLVAYKPQLALLIPFALAAGGRWRAFLAAATTVAALVALTSLLYGPDCWREFFAATQGSRQMILDQGRVGYEKMVSVFAWMRLWKAPLTLAYLVQAAVALAVLVETVRIWRTNADPRLKGAALCLGALLATPFALDYDLMLLAPAVALVAMHGIEKRFAPYQASVLSLLWLMPLLQRPLAGALLLPVATWSVIAGFLLVSRRAHAA
jgi:hypothetical protein